MHSFGLEQIIHALGGPKPGFEAQKRMLPDPRPGTRPVEEVEGMCSKAGVLLLLYPLDGEIGLVLTRRTESVLNHQGQISLPGGRREEGESLRAAAFRETEEELGIGMADIDVLGDLTPLYIPPSRYCIYPWVAAAQARPVFHPSPKEVAEILEVPLLHLLDDRNVGREERRIRGRYAEVPYYRFRDHKIWGATAMVLAEFLAYIRGSS